MHETSLAAAMVEQLQPVFARENVQRVCEIELELGALSCVEEDAFNWAFAAAAAGTPAADAALHYIRIPVRVECATCGARTEPPFPAMLCMACDGTRVEVVAGRDFKIRSMEVL